MAQAADVVESSPLTSTVTLGLIAPPGVTGELSERIAAEVPDALRERIEPRASWEVRVAIDPLAGAGDASEMLDETHRRALYEGWDLGICVTDLPVLRRPRDHAHGRRIVVADLSHQRRIAGVSMPAFGICRMHSRLRQTVLRLAEELYHARQGPDGSDSHPEQSWPATDRLIPGWLSSITVPTRRQGPVEEEGVDTRFVSPAGRGHIRLWAAMVADNRPWNLFHNFSAVIAAAFGTGAFALVFPSIYHLADHFSLTRMVVVMLLAMTAMVSWIIVSHDLWEPGRNQRGGLPLAALYNWITVLTLTVAVLMAYVVLLAMLLAAALVFVPQAHLELQLGHPVSFGFYPLLAWLAASVATVAGALGSGLENDEEVRQVTFGARQQQRLLQTQRNRSEDNQD